MNEKYGGIACIAIVLFFLALIFSFEDDLSQEMKTAEKSLNRALEYVDELRTQYDVDCVELDRLQTEIDYALYSIRRYE